MRATIKDVAKLAGVSIKTVSNVLNGYPYLTPETKGKVEAALAELDYRPNMSARNLRLGRTGIIALALPNVSSPYFAEIAHLIVKEAQARSLTVLIDCTGGELEREKLVAEAFRSQLIDGMILQPWSLSERYLRSRSDQTPLVLLGERSVKSADSVAIDSHAAALAAVEHLLALGRRRIGVIGARAAGRGVRRPLEPGRRLEGYTEAITQAGIDFDPSLISHPGGDHTPEVVEPAMFELLDRAPDLDGLFCFNDRIAMAASHALASRRIAVPRDVAIVSIDDVEPARVASPTISTIAPDKAGIARTAVEMLAERIAGTDRPARHVIADFTLIERQSTAGRVGKSRRRTSAKAL